MAILSNINGKFAVDSTGAIQFSGAAGTNGYVLKSTGSGTAPTWVDPDTIIGPYLPLSGGTLTGATATASNIAFTVGGTLTVSGSGGSVFNSTGASNHIVAAYRATNGNNVTTFRTTDSGYIFKIHAQNSGTIYVQNDDGSNYLKIPDSGSNEVSGNTTFAGTVLIDGLSNYTGLEVKGSGASRPAVNFTNATQGNLGRIYGTEGNALILASGSSNATALTLDSSQNATFAGNVGIGSASAGSQLEVVGGGYNSIRIANATGAGDKTAGISTLNHAGNGTSIIQYHTNSSHNDVYYGSADSGFRGITSHYFYTNSGVDTASSGHTLNLTLSGGNATFAGDIQAPGIYVGSTNASYDFYNNGTSYLNGATIIDDTLTITSATNMLLTLNPTAGNYGGILFQYGGVSKGSSIYNSGLMVYGGESGIATRLQAGGGYGLHIDYTNKNTHFGGTTDSTGSKVRITSGSFDGLHILSQTAGGACLKVQADSGTTTNSILSYTDQAAGTGWYHLVCQAGNPLGNMLIIYGNGNVTNLNNSYGQTSDRNLKENIIDATPKLEDIKKLKVKNFNFKGDDLKQIGMIAQEVEEVFPGLVDEIEDPKTKEKSKSLKYSVFVPMLIKSIQELEARVKELENK